MTRVVFAYFSCLVAMYLAASSSHSGGGDGIGAIGAMFFIFTMLLGLLVLPVIILRKMGWLAWWQLAIIGSLVLLIPSGIFISDHESTNEALMTIGSLMSIGAIFGFVFWVLAIYKNKAFDDQYTRVSRKALKRIFLIGFIGLSYFVCIAIYESIKYKLDTNWIAEYSCQMPDKSIYPIASAESIKLYNTAIQEEEKKWAINDELYKSSLQRAAELGNWQAINKLISDLRYDRKEEELAKWSKILLDMGVPEGFNAMADIYLNGTGTKESEKLSIYYTSIAAKMGDSEAEYILGKYLLEHKRESKNYFENGLKLLTCSNDKGNVSASLFFADFYADKNDLDKAFSYYVNCAKNGYSTCLDEIGYAYKQSLGGSTYNRIKDSKRGECLIDLSRKHFKSSASALLDLDTLCPSNVHQPHEVK